MKHTRKSFLAMLRSEQVGYKGKADLTEVAAFLAENAIEVVDPDGEKITSENVGDVWAKALTLTDPGDEDETAPPRQSTKATSEDIADIVAMRAELAKIKTALDRATAGNPVAKVNAGLYGGIAPKTVRPEVLAYKSLIKQGKSCFDDADKAEAFGAWAKLAYSAGREYTGKNIDAEIFQKANLTTQFTLGGSLVPDVFVPELTALRLSYGIAEQILNVSDVPDGAPRSYQRRTTDLTVYGPEEGASITESNPAFDQIQVIPSERKTYTTISNTLMADAAISMADQVAQAAMQAFAKDLDDAAFIGTGTSTYFGVTGFNESLRSLSTTRAEIAGLAVGSGNLYSELALVDFEAVCGRLPDYTGFGDPFWVMNKRFYEVVAKRLALAAGGVTSMEILGGRIAPSLLGYPVRFANSMPRTEANDQVCCLLGWFNRAGRLNRVTGSMEFAQSEHVGFQSDKMAFRVKHRVGITIHDVGNSSATESLREPGPVVGLLTAAS